jgi:hypothetical protein
LRTNERNNRKKHSDWALHENTVIGRGLTWKLDMATTI